MNNSIAVKPVENEKVARNPLALDFVSFAERCSSRRPKEQIRLIILAHSSPKTCHSEMLHRPEKRGDRKLALPATKGFGCQARATGTGFHLGGTDRAADAPVAVFSTFFEVPRPRRCDHFHGWESGL
jgi:hypothetical protein